MSDDPWKMLLEYQKMMAYSSEGKLKDFMSQSMAIHGQQFRDLYEHKWNDVDPILSDLKYVEREGTVIKKEKPVYEVPDEPDPELLCAAIEHMLDEVKDHELDEFTGLETELLQLYKLKDDRKSFFDLPPIRPMTGRTPYKSDFSIIMDEVFGRDLTDIFRDKFAKDTRRYDYRDFKRPKTPVELERAEPAPHKAMKAPHPFVRDQERRKFRMAELRKSHKKK